MGSLAEPLESIYGRRLVVSLIDDIAKQTPERVYADSPVSSNVEDGFQQTTYGQLADAINTMAWLIEHEFGKAKGFPTIAYLGPPDLRYPILVIAAQKTGYRAFLPSSRNSIEAHLHLLEEADCKIFLTSRALPAGIEEVIDRRPMRHLAMPELSSLIGSQAYPFPFKKAFDEAERDPFVVLHTSGSTGMPKLVIPTQATMATQDAVRLMPNPRRTATSLMILENARVFVGLPPFHVAGIWTMLVLAVYYGSTPVLPPPRPLTADIVNAIHVHGNLKASMTVPSIIEDIVGKPDWLENLSRVDYVAYAGGTLSKDAGGKVSQRASIVSVLGSTETMLLPILYEDAKDWQYYGFDPCMGGEFRHRWNDLYEMVIVRRPELSQFQAVFHTFPEIEEYAMQDLFSPHPTKRGLWLHRGRMDDVIVFSTGEKINPLDMESTISTHTEISAALVVGQGRFQSALLIEPKEQPATAEERQALLGRIWPSVERANRDCPAHGEIYRDFVLFTSPDKPMIRAGKGTVQRMSTVRQYEPELDALYEKSSMSYESSSSRSIEMADDFTIIRTLRAMIRPFITGARFDDDDDLFHLGLDSLKVATLVRKINMDFMRMGKTDITVSPPTIYSNPTLKSLSIMLATQARLGKPSTVQPTVINGIRNRQQEMSSTFNKFVHDLPICGRDPTPLSLSARKIVILTGSTGSVGSYLLDALLKDASIAKVYCFNRKNQKMGIARQIEIMEANGLTTYFSASRVVFLDTDLGRPYFGLSHGLYSGLLRSVTHIIHNAWEVNFYLSLQSFINPHIDGVRRFIDFSGHSRYGARIFFISTIGTVLHWTTMHGGAMPEASPNPEASIDDWKVTQETGYAESKAIAESLLKEACRVSHVPCTIARVGQVAGPTRQPGNWNSKEWFPSLIRSSVHLGVLPSDLGTMQIIDWVPIDALANAIVELAVEDDNDDQKWPSAKIYHLVNPQHTTYDRLLPEIQAELPRSTKLVTLADWVSTLAASSEQDLAKNPAAKLLVFFQNLISMKEQGQKMVVLDTTQTRQQSKTLNGLEAVKADWMQLWMKGWKL